MRVVRRMLRWGGVKSMEQPLRRASEATKASRTSDGVPVMHRKSNRGAVLVMVTAMMVVLIAMGSLAVDVAYLVVIRNQLQNAADAGALAGARSLYLAGGQEVNPGANVEGQSAAVANFSQGEPVECDVDGGNGPDVVRGHWSFANREFTPNESLVPVDLWNRSTQDLDLATDFINAVWVQVRREAIPAQSFLSRILGYDSFELQAEAVGYIGFAGTLRPEDVDQPIGICQQAIRNADGEYTCTTGRMINSGQGGGGSHNTAGWVNFDQESCSTANSQSVGPLLCGDGNPDTLLLGVGMGSTGGQLATVYDSPGQPDTLRSCWMQSASATDSRGYPIEPWRLTLPVIDCPGNNISNCAPLQGAVTLDVLFIKGSPSRDTQAGGQYHDIPVQMRHPDLDSLGFECSSWVTAGRPTDIEGFLLSISEAQRQQCWEDFAEHFNLRATDGTSVGDIDRNRLATTMYFLPSCEAHDLRGTTGGQNFGILARIPVLVN